MEKSLTFALFCGIFKVIDINVEASMTDNVCKFSLNRSSDLICENFIYETGIGRSSRARAASHYVGLVSSGEGKLDVGGFISDISAGTLFFVPIGLDFSIKSTRELKYFYVCFHGRRADELIERFLINEANCVFDGYTELLPFWKDAQSRADNGTIDILCEAVLLYSLGHLKPAATRSNDVVSNIVAITQKNFANPNLSISSIAASLGYDAKYLSSIFKKKRGVSYTTYLRDLRIRRAIFLMEQGLVSVKNIASLSGFSDALYFSKVFSGVEGIPPSEYITQLDKQRAKQT